MQDCTDFQRAARAGQDTRVLGAVLSAGGAQHAACRGSGGGGAVMGVVVVRRWAREDGVSVGRGAAELEPP